MFPLSPLRRLLVVLLAVVQVGAPVLATAAHAALARAVAGDVERLHVEAPGQRHAPLDHPESCVLCQIVGRALAVPVELAEPIRSQASESVGADDADRQVKRPAVANIRTRAPPDLV